MSAAYYEAIVRAQNGVDNRPGVCSNCHHARTMHGRNRGACSLDGCTCEDFTGPVEIVIKHKSRSWPLCYTRTGRVAHILEPYRSTNSSDPALCGVSPWPDCWRGSGTWRENERVNELPRCANCTRKFDRWHEGRLQ
jgi:hypothetical protein